MDDRSVEMQKDKRVFLPREGSFMHKTIVWIKHAQVH